MLGFIYIIEKRKKLILPAIAAMSTFGIALFFLKKDSAQGRLYIWKITFDIIKDNLLSGYGTNGFSSNFMYRQAQYFVQNPTSEYLHLADQINHPFNEFILLAVNYGIITSILILYCFIKWIWDYKNTVPVPTSVVFLILIYSFFSYPLHYYFVVLIILLCLSETKNISNKNPIKWSIRRHQIVLIVGSILSTSVFYYSFLEVKWERATNATEFDKSKYEELDFVLNGITEFHHDYAHKLYLEGKYKKSIEQLTRFEEKEINYYTTLLKGFNYLKLKDYENAVEAFLLCKQMIPSRFTPKYELLKIYKEIYLNDSLGLKMAREINQTKMKIITEYSISVKSAAQNYLRKKVE